MTDNTFYIAIKDNITKEKIKNMYRAVGVFIMFLLTTYAYPLSFQLSGASSEIIKEAYRVLDNHRVFVFNVGDVSGNDNLVVNSVWGKRRLPLGVYFIKIFEECGFTFVDDFIWDKGEVQSQRHKNGSKPYPLYQYPMNCYEHILVFHKHRLDKTKYPCPICGKPFIQIIEEDFGSIENPKKYIAPNVVEKH